MRNVNESRSRLPICSLAAAASIGVALLPFSLDAGEDRMPLEAETTERRIDPKPEARPRTDSDAKAPALAAAGDSMVPRPSQGRFSDSLPVPVLPQDPGSGAAEAQLAQAPATPGRGVQELLDADSETLRQIVLSSPSSDLAHAAVWAMGNRLMISDADVAALTSRLRSTTAADGSLRRAILWAFALEPDRAPVDLVFEMATAVEDESVRRTALRTLGLGHDPAAVPALVEIARLDSDPTNRAEAITLLALHLTAEDAAQVANAGLAGERDPLVRERWTNLLELASEG